MDPNLIDQLGAVVISVVGSALTALVSAGIWWLAGKIKSDKLQRYLKEQQLADVVATAAVGYGEEFARKWLKSNAEKVPGVDKLDAAAEWFRANARGPIEKWADDKVKGYLEAKLGMARNGTAVGNGLLDPTSELQ